MVANGLGVTLLPEIAAIAENERATDLTLRSFKVPPTRSFGLLYRSSSGRHREMRMLREAIRSARPHIGRISMT